MLAVIRRVFSVLAECISLYAELSQILLSSGWISSLVHTLTAVKGLSNASLLSLFLRNSVVFKSGIFSIC